MRIRLYKRIIILLFEMLALPICSCDTLSNSLRCNDVNLYSDSNPFENEKVKIDLDCILCSPDCDNYKLSFNIKITNKGIDTVEFEFQNKTLVRESTGAKYNISNTYKEIPYNGDTISLDSELTLTSCFSSRIPSSIESDKYFFTIKINSLNITCFLYEMPEDLRIDRNVEYHISDELVNSITIKDKRRIDYTYVYESNGNLSYCDKWHLDENLITKNLLFNTKCIK